VGPLQGFRSRLGRPFAATIKLSAENKLEFDFGHGSGANGAGPAEPVDFSTQEPLGRCPKCNSRVFENGTSYLCEKAAASPRGCSFRTGKVILQRTIDRAQIVKLLTQRKTDLIDKFISKKGRPFSAFLFLTPEGKVGFEFAPRAPRPKPGAHKTAAPKTAAPKAETQPGTAGPTHAPGQGPGPGAPR